MHWFLLGTEAAAMPFGIHLAVLPFVQLHMHVTFASVQYGGLFEDTQMGALLGVTAANY